jgi:1,4-dihydroxy-2-naphthoyl-CoA hydrolase
MHAYDELYGLEVDAATGEEARGTVAVSDAVRQPAGLVHGGIYASIAESLATRATETALGDGAIAAGQNSQTSFLRPITEGTIHAVARRRHRGRSTWVWEVELADDHGRLCALVRMTIAVRDLPSAATA